MPYCKFMKVLRKHGWEIVRKKGSHTRLENKHTKQRTTMSYHEGTLDGRDIKILSKQFGINLKESR